MKIFVRSIIAAVVIGGTAFGSASVSQARDPAYAYTGDPAYAGYRAYAYSPRYAGHRHRYHRGYGYHAETRSVPRHYDPGEGYNSNTISPWQDWKYQGRDY